MVSQPFRAFVSYCHADRPFAARLQRRLESYRLPRRLAGQVPPLAGQPAGRIGPVFRDRADLSAAVDLSQAVRDAIKASSALVVVASPDAVQSHWVDREIELFRADHPDAPILVAHCAGDPAAAMPMALRRDGAEPLAADFRREGDGYRLAFLKIVGGLAGLPLDALVQRDAQRQVRRVTAVTLGALALALVMAALLVATLRARSEAIRQRADAEGLIDYMITDLRKELMGDGRFRILDAVNERALGYYSAQGDLGSLPDDSLDRRARVLLAMGEDDANRGLFDKAFAEFGEAHRTTAAILARRPQDPTAIFSHAQSEYWVGSIWEHRKDWVRAGEHYRAYDAYAQRLVAIDPANPKYLLEAGYGQMNLGELQSESKTGPDFGRKRIIAALGWFEKAAARKPGDPDIAGEIANARAWLADSYYQSGDLAQSLAQRRQELAMREKIVAIDPTNNAARFRLAKAQFGVGQNLMETGRKDEARPLLTAARATMVNLVAIEPDNTKWVSILDRTNQLLK